MAGNVREWCLNDAGRRQRFILGGGWSDPTYAFVDAYAQPPMDRSAINGIRLARYDPADTTSCAVASGRSRARSPTTRKVRPVPDAVFAGIPRPVRLRPDARSTPRSSRATRRSEDWIAEKVSFTAAYGNER